MILKVKEIDGQDMTQILIVKSYKNLKVMNKKKKINNKKNQSKVTKINQMNV